MALLTKALHCAQFMAVVAAVDEESEEVVEARVAETIQGVLAIELKSNWYVTPVFGFVTVDAGTAVRGAFSVRSFNIWNKSAKASESAHV